MTRRLAIAMVVLVAGALFVAGVGSAVLIRYDTRRHARASLVVDARNAASSLDQLGTTPGIRNRRPAAGLVTLRRARRLTGGELPVLLPRGALSGPLPAGVTAADLDTSARASGQIVSGGHGRLVYAAAPATSGL